MRQAVGLGGQEFEARCRDPGCKGLVTAPVTADRGINTLFEQNAKGLVQAIDGIDRGGMVIGPSANPAPIAHQQTDIEQPGTSLSLARGNRLSGSGAEGNGGQTGRRAKALLSC